MAEEEFEVHGPHDHAVEHGGHGGDSFASGIAVMTAILATLGAMFGYEGGATQNEAALLKNDAAITMTKASDKWNQYQADSNKQHLAELAVSLPGVDQAKYKADVDRYTEEKKKVKAESEALEAKVEELDKQSEVQMHHHHLWARATTAEQIAISLAAIALLTRKKWLQYAAYAVAIFGTGVGLFAFLQG